MKKYLAGMMALVLVLVLATGCNGVSTSIQPATVSNLPPGKGILEVYVTDAPGDMETCSITIDGLEAHRAGGSWEDIVFDEGETKTFNLLEFENGLKAFLAGQIVDAGWYTQLRLHIVDNVLIEFEDDDTDYYAKVPSGEIKLVGPFEIPENGVAEITLDFDVEKSVHEIGAQDKEYSYIFEPVIKLLVSEPMGLETRGENASAEWTDEIDPGNYSFELYVLDGTVDMAAVVFEVDIALEDINTLSFNKWVSDFGSSGWNPSIILGIDADNDGEYEAPDDLGWHFTHAPADLGDDAFIEGEFPTGLTATDTDWVTVNAIIDMKWWGAIADDFVYPTAGYAALNADGGFQKETVGIIDPTDHVRVVKIVIGGAGSWMDETAYIDDFVIAGP
jgi:hypothetical protein